MSITHISLTNVSDTRIIKASVTHVLVELARTHGYETRSAHTTASSGSICPYGIQARAIGICGRLCPCIERDPSLAI